MTQSLGSQRGRLEFGVHGCVGGRRAFARTLGFEASLTIPSGMTPTLLVRKKLIDYMHMMVGPPFGSHVYIYNSHI